jgi:hypothetical protein
MKTDPGSSAKGASSGGPLQRHVFGWPSTRPGWWAVRLAVTFMVLWIISSTLLLRSTGLAPWWQIVLPFYGIFMMLCGLAGGIVGLLAVIRRHERSWLVWLAILVGLFVIVFILAEILIPH